MRFLIIVLAFILSSNVSVPQSDVNIAISSQIEMIDGKNYYIHEIQKGQTLYSISRAYQVNLDQVLRENPETRGGLKTGTKIRIPASNVELPEFKPLSEKNFDFFYHVAKTGETFRDISYIYLVDENYIHRANPDLIQPLKEGDYVKVPVVVRNGNNNEPKRDPEPVQLSAEPVMKTTQAPKAVEPEADKPGEYFKHIVKKGETLFGISRLYEVTVDDIRSANPRLSPNIGVGQLLKIPGTKKVITEQPTALQDDEDPDFINHVVKSGETIYRIARNYKISIDSLKIFNPGLTDRIKVGQVIRIPVVKSNKKFILHKVDEKKEKLQKVAKKYDLQVSELRQINPYLPNKLFRGQIVRIPVEYEELPVAIKDTTDLEIVRIDEDLDRDSLRCFRDSLENISETYKIALMLPFYLEEVDSLLFEQLLKEEEIPLPNSFRFIQFYEGLMMAVDTLRNRGLNVELFVYDINRDESKTRDILARPEMRHMDLIIGPLFSSDFSVVSKFARNHRIKIVNPFTTKKELLAGNPFVFKVQPSEAFQLNQVVEFVSHEFPDAKIILVRGNIYQNTATINEYKASFEGTTEPVFQVPNYRLHNILVEKSKEENEEYEDEEDLLASIMVEERLLLKEDISDFIDDTTMFINKVSEVIYMQDSIYGVIEQASVVRKNVIIAMLDDKGTILDLLANLNILRDTFDIHLIGLPDWNRYADFQPELFLNLDLHVFSPTFTDYEDPFVDWFISGFRSRYFTEPDFMAFQGFDIAWFFGNALMTFGDDFEKCLDYYNPELLQTRFYFENNPRSGYENSYWNIYNFDDYRMNEIENHYFENKEDLQDNDKASVFDIFE